MTSFTDAMVAAERMADAKYSATRSVYGFGVVQLLDAEGRELSAVPFSNTVTDAGDTYHATRVAAAVNSNGVAQPTILTGMQIGSGSTAVNKAAGTGVTLGSYLFGQGFDATYPTVTAIGTNLGTQVTYKVTYGAGNGTGAVSEAALVNGTVTTASLTATNVIARTVFTTVNKGASDTLAITWNVKFLGS